MTNYVDTITNSVVTSLDVLKSVNDMYSSEFTRLLTVMGLLVGLVGVAVIVLPLWLQSREAKVRREEMKAELAEQIKEAKAELNATVKQSLEAEKLAIHEIIGKSEKKFADKVAVLTALSTHIQMELAVKDEKYVHAAESALICIQSACKCDDHSNVLRTIGDFTALICPHLKKLDIEDQPLGEQLTKVEKILQEANKTGFLNDKLRDLKKAKKEILSR